MVRGRILSRVAWVLPVADNGPVVRLPLCLLLAVILPCCGGRAAVGAASRPTVRSVATATRTARPLRYAVLGDSYSNGQSVSPQRAWPVVMAGLLTRGGLPVQVVANPSVTGATTAQMLSIGIGPIRASRPDVMTVMLGVNDQVQSHGTAQFAADYGRALADAIAITGSPRRVLAVDIPDYSVTPAGAQFGQPAQIAAQIDAFNRIVRTVAAHRHVQVVSVVTISRRDGAADLAGDGLHPSGAQLEQWARHIAPVARQAWLGLVPRSS